MNSECGFKGKVRIAPVSDGREDRVGTESGAFLSSPGKWRKEHVWGEFGAA